MSDYPFLSPLYLGLTILYFFVASIVTFDMRLNQAKMFEGVDYGTLPAWTGIFYYLQWAIFIVLAILNWKYALIIFGVKFILKFLPVLETIGNILMSPFKPKVNSNKEPEEAGRKLQELTGINYKDVLADMQKKDEEVWENREKLD